MQGIINAGNAVILLEHDLREETVEVGQAVSGMISEAGRVNCPVAAVFGDPQRYQGTNLQWPVAGTNGFDPSFNPVSGSNRHVPGLTAIINILVINPLIRRFEMQFLEAIDWLGELLYCL